jgi:DNA-binding transcriptional LysR family regulator
MEIYQLELFLAVVKAGSLTQAARDRGLSPGALSQQLQKLNAELGTRLFAKSGRGITLTPEGQQFAERARRLLVEVDELRRGFSGDPERDTSPFHLATGATTLIHALSKPLRSLRRRYPNANIRVTVANTEEMVEGLIRRRFDLAIISLPLNDDRLSITPLYDEELLVLRPSDKPLNGWRVGEIHASELDSDPFLLYPPDSNMRQLIDRHFAKHGVSPRVAMEAADTEVIIRLVEAGFGQSILPAYALRRSPRYFRVLRIAEGRLFRQQAIASLRAAAARPLTMAITRFIQLSLR